MSDSKGKYNTKKSVYTYGNTARQLEIAEPFRQPERRGRHNEEEEKRVRKLRQKEIQRAHKVNFLYTVAVVGVLAFIFTVCVQYLELQSNVKTSSSKVASLESKLTKMEADNDMTEVEINGSIDYDAILDTAVNELGMVYPERKQVIQYDSSESEYVKQYSDIPEAK